MRILIVNDDGMHAAALPHLIRWARELGEVTCVVPKHEQSGKSQAIDFTQPVEIKQTEIAPDITVWAMDSTPADCVRFGVTGLGITYELILSGINRGYIKIVGADIPACLRFPHQHFYSIILPMCL